MRRIGLALLLLLASSLAGLAATSIFDVKSGLVQFLLSQVSTPGSFEVTVEGVESPGEGVTRLTGLKVSDAAGVWVTADSVALGWDAARLLAGELVIPEIAIGNLAILRMPAPGSQAPTLKPGVEDPAASPFDWPRSPIALEITNLRLTGVSVAEGVLPQAIRFDATGAAADRGDGQSLRLALTRTDAVAGQIAFDYARDFAAGTLRLTLEADEAAGGLVAAAAGFPADAASRLSLVADGPREDWRLRFRAETGEVYQAEGTAAVSWVAPLSVDADFRLTPGPAMSDTARALLAPSAALTARLREAEGVVRIEALSLTAPDITLTAAGSFARADARMALDVALEGKGGLAALTPGIAFTRFGFAGTLAGVPEDLTARGDLSLDGLATARVDAARLALTVDATRRAALTFFALAGTGEGLRLDRLAPATVGPVSLTARGSLTGSRLRLTDAGLTAALLAVTATGETDTGFRDARLDVTARLPSLAPLAADYGTAAEGAAEIDGTLTLTAGVPLLTATGQLTGFRSAPADLDRFSFAGSAEGVGEGLRLAATGDAMGLRLDRLGAGLIGPARLALAGTLTGDRLELAGASLASALLTAHLAGLVEGGRIALGYQARTADLAPVAAAYGQDVAGALVAQGRVTGEADSPPRIAGALTLTGARFGGQDLGDLALRHDVTVGDAVAGALDLTATAVVPGGLRLATGFRWAAPRLTLTGLDAAGQGLTATGDLDLDTTTRLAAGKLAVTAGDLDPLARRAGVDLRGSLTGTLRLSAPKGRQAVALDLTAARLAQGDLALAKLRVEGTVTDPLGTPALRLKASGAGLVAGPLSLTRLSLTARGGLDAVAVVAEGKGSLGPDPFSLATRARVRLEPGLAATLTELAATLKGETLRQAGPLTVTPGPGGLRLAGVDLALPKGGRLSGDLTLGPGLPTGSLRLDGLDLSLLGRLAGVPLEKGQLSGALEMTPRRGSLTARAEGLRLTGIAGEAGALGAELTGDWDGRRATLGLTLSGDFGDPVQARLALPLRPSGPDWRGAVQGSLDWQGEIGRIWPLLPLADHELTGPARVALRLGGSLAAPQISGDVGVTGGRYQNLAAGMILTDVGIASRIEAGRDLVLTLTARDGADGVVAGEARITSGTGPPALDAQVTATRAILIRRDDATLRLSGAVTAKGDLTAPAIAGQITVDRGEIRLVDTAPPGIIDLGPVRRKGEKLAAREEETARIPLDITIFAPGQVFVRGRGLDSEWRIDLKVGGTATRPRIKGEIARLRGRMDLIGKDFALKEGVIGFDGGREIDPTLRVVLEREDNDLTGRISVTGRASAPEIGFSSTPALPEDEVLPRLLFGTSKQALTPGQALSLANGLRVLSTGDAGPLDVARAALGVDTLQVDPGVDGNASVTVGKSLAPGVFVGAKRELGAEGGTSVTVEIEVFPNVTIEGEAGTNSSKLGVGWKKDF